MGGGVPNPNHVPAAESNFLHYGYTATCSCGWRGWPAHDSEASAIREAQKHVAGAAGGPKEDKHEH